MADENTNDVQAGPATETEIIPGTAVVTRLIDSPRMYAGEQGLLWTTTFEFPQSAGESVNWDKYAPPPDEVHRLGREREAAKRDARPEFRYVGFIPAIAQAVREIRTVRGHSLEVEHVPSEGVHHAEIRYAPSAASPLHKGDKGELKFALQQVFGNLVPRPPDES